MAWKYVDLDTETAKYKEVANDNTASETERRSAREKGGHRAARSARKGTGEAGGGPPLRERLKAIFRKYGFALADIALAVGTTIGVVISSLTKGMKSVTAGVGKGLKCSSSGERRVGFFSTYMSWRRLGRWCS